MCELSKLFGLCFLVFLSQASWTVTIHTHSQIVIEPKIQGWPCAHLQNFLTVQLSPSSIPTCKFQPSASMTSHLCPCHVLQELLSGSCLGQLQDLPDLCLLLPLIQCLKTIVLYILFPSCFPVLVFSNEYKFKLWYNLLGSEPFVFVILILYIKYYQVLLSKQRVFYVCQVV